MATTSCHVVTIDGPAGTGKSTAARALANRLGWALLDTGAMYRAVALAATQRGVALDDATQLGLMIDQLSYHQGDQKIELDGVDVTLAIRSPEISELASRVAQLDVVRAALVVWQRACAVSRETVAEGRDQGTVVFPDAIAKFFLTALPEARARRRCDELAARGISCDLAQVLAEQASRDARDAQRSHSPMIPAADALVIDTSSLTATQVVDALEAVVRARLVPDGADSQARAAQALSGDPVSDGCDGERYGERINAGPPKS